MLMHLHLDQLVMLWLYLLRRTKSTSVVECSMTSLNLKDKIKYGDNTSVTCEARVEPQPFKHMIMAIKMALNHGKCFN